MVEARFYKKGNKEVIVYCDIYNNKELLESLVVSNNNELFNYNFIENSNNYNLGDISFFENEIFSHYYLKYLARIDYLFLKYSVNKVSFVGENILFLYIKSFCSLKKIRTSKSLSETLSNISILIHLFKYICIAIAGACYFCFYLIFKRKEDTKNVLKTDKEFALIHSKAAFDKIHNVLKDNITYYYDSTNQVLPNGKNLYSFYSVLSREDILKNFFTLPFETLSLFWKTLNSSSQLIGYKGAILSMGFFAKRISHFALIRKCYLNIFKNSKSNHFYSGEKQSRYGLLAMDIREEKKINAICIPHGMAFSYKYPLGMFGDKYYCTTEVEAEFLKNQYNSDRFVFDKSVTNKMYFVNSQNKDQSIIFFTEPRRIKVNLEIINVLHDLLPLVKIKLHPLDNKSNYLQFDNIEYIDGFAESISNNICIARKSTILLEALYNNSLPISVLFDSADRFDFENAFPSLNTEGIRKVYTIEQLNKLLLESLK